jgi:hypothetical protein
MNSNQPNQTIPLKEGANVNVPFPTPLSGVFPKGSFHKKQHITPKKNKHFVDYFTIKNCERQLTEEELEYCVYAYNANLILYNQKLTPEFIVKHIWNQRNNGTAEESYLTEYDILKAQPHITVEEWDDAVEKFGIDEE